VLTHQQIFDAPFLVNKQFEERLAFLKSIFGEPDAPKYPNVRVVEHTECKGKVHVMETLEQLQNKGAEGLMLRQPKSYVPLYGILSPTLIMIIPQNLRTQAFFNPPQSENFLRR
jgi:hypothetical protein